MATTEVSDREHDAANIAKVRRWIGDCRGMLSEDVGREVAARYDFDAGRACHTYITETALDCIEWMAEGSEILSRMTRAPSADGVAFWVETRLRDALDNEEHLMSALGMFKVAMDRQDTPRDMIRKVLADFVFNAFGIAASSEGEG